MYNQISDAIKSQEIVWKEDKIANVYAELDGITDPELVEYREQEICGLQRQLDKLLEKPVRTLVVGRHDPDDDRLEIVMHNVTWNSHVTWDDIKAVYEFARENECQAILWQNFPAQLAAALFALYYDYGLGTLSTPHFNGTEWTVVSEPRPDLRGEAPELEVCADDIAAVIEAVHFANPRMKMLGDMNNCMTLKGQAPMPFERVHYTRIS